MKKFNLDLTKLIGFRIATSDKAQSVLSSAKIGSKTELVAADTKTARAGA